MSLHDIVNRRLSNRIVRFCYAIYKKHRIIESLRLGSFDITKLERGYGLGLDERLIEYPWLFSSLPSKEGNFLDAGSVLNFDYILSLPTLVQKKIFISTLAPEKHSFWNKSISYVYEDLRDICYKNNFFDWIVCLSVIEHIGLDNTKFYTNNPAMMNKH